MKTIIKILLITLISGCQSSSLDEGRTAQIRNQISDYAKLEKLMEPYRNDLTFRIEMNGAGDVYLTNRKIAQHQEFKAPNKAEFSEIMKKLRIWSITTFDGFYIIISVGPEKRKSVKDLEYWINIYNYFDKEPPRLCETAIFITPLGSCDLKVEGNWYLSYSWFPKRKLEKNR